MAHMTGSHSGVVGAEFLTCNAPQMLGLYMAEGVMHPLRDV